MRKIGLIAIAVGLSSCQTDVSPTQAASTFKTNLQADGINPLVRYPALQKIEIELRDYVMQPTPDMQMDMLIQLTASEIGAARFRQEIASLDKGAEALIAARYSGSPATGGSCVVEPTVQPYRLKSQAPASIDWSFQNGTCVDGKAEGVASVVSPDGNYRFTGMFKNGRAIEGIFQDASMNLVYDGALSQDGEAVQASFRHHRQGNQPLYYVGWLQNGLPNGKGVVAVSDVYGALQVTSVGGFKDDALEGFGARRNIMNFEGGGRKWGAWIGNWSNGRTHGIAGYTNDADTIFVGTYENGQGNGLGGMYYADLYDSVGGVRSFRFGGYRNGQRHGGHIIQNAWSGFEAREVWNNGRLVEDDSFDFGQVFALAAGTALIGAADIPSAAKVQLGGAYAADVLGNTGGGNTLNTANRLSNNIAANRPLTGPNAARPTTAAASAGGAMRQENYSFTCAAGDSYTIPVPYRDASKLGVKKAYAKTMACNEVGNWSKAIADCERTFGNKTCQEQ